MIFGFGLRHFGSASSTQFFFRQRVGFAAATGGGCQHDTALTEFSWRLLPGGWLGLLGVDTRFEEGMRFPQAHVDHKLEIWGKSFFG